MNPFKCRHCDKPAHFYFREGGMLCPDHGALHATAQMRDMLERSRLDKSDSELRLSCDIRAAAAAEINVRSHSSPMHDGRTWEQRRALNNGDSLVLEPTLTGRGPCDSGATNSPSPPTDLSSPVAGALANTPLPVTAGAALSDDRIAEFLDRRKTSAFRVAASSLIQESSHMVSASVSIAAAGHCAVVDAHNTIVRGG